MAEDLVDGAGTARDVAAVVNDVELVHQGVELEGGEAGAGVGVVEVDQIDGVGIIEDADGLGADAAEATFAVVDDGDAAGARATAGGRHVGRWTSGGGLADGPMIGSGIGERWQFIRRPGDNVAVE
jgi:hypothetical protein